MRSTRTMVLVVAALFAVPAHGADFSGLDVLLAKYVDASGLVDYHTWKHHDEPALDRVMGVIASGTPDSFTIPQERLAFWINAYNACVIKGVLGRLPIRSVQDVPGFFEEKAYRVAGITMSLNQIENERIRPVFKDPRIHFALVCAARSCPRLLNRAYTGFALEQVLDNQARQFLADPAKNRFDAPANRAIVSSLFKWYASDFTENAGSLVAYLRRYAPADAQPLLARPDVRVAFMPYDWSLNQRPGAGSGGGSGGSGSRDSR